MSLKSKTALTYDLWVGGESVAASGADRIPVLAPATGEVCGYVGDATEMDGLSAVDAAAVALPEWRSATPRHRAEVLRRCFELMIDRSDSLARLISRENGKTFSDARAEVLYAAEFFRWYSEEAVRVIGQISQSPAGSNRVVVQYEPIGVAVLITPWNFPAAMATRKIAPALAAGCTVVLKPATETPLTAYAIAQICVEAGAPAGAVNVITTRQTRDVVSRLLHDDRVRALSFTGSTPVGKHLLREAADQVLRCSMELGGNAPFIVFDDADVADAVEGLMIAKMRNGGQACTAANRIYAQKGIAEELSRRLALRMSALVMGDGLDDETQCGPLINDRAVDKVHDLVEDALTRGARLETGGVRVDRPGSFYPPTVLADVPESALINREEIFGPVASISTFETEEEVIETANSTELGLSAYVYTNDLGRGMRVAERIEAGMVAINRGLVSDAAAPFGGVKQSGLGREGGHEGILEYMEAKYIAVGW